MSTGVPQSSSLPKLQTNMAALPERGNIVASPPTSPTVSKQNSKAIPQKPEPSGHPLKVNTDPEAPSPSMFSTIQSVFQYISTSDSHPPPPPKPKEDPPPGAGTSGGSTLINPHKPNQQTVRGGGAHGAGTLGKGVARPIELVKTAKNQNEMFRGQMHQDAHEFLMWTLNQVSSDVEQLETRMAKDPSLGMYSGAGLVTLTYIASVILSNHSWTIRVEWWFPKEEAQGQDFCSVFVRRHHDQRN
jgi:hypothetical protein